MMMQTIPAAGRSVYPVAFLYPLPQECFLFCGFFVPNFRIGLLHNEGGDIYDAEYAIFYHYNQETKNDG
ncbi:hypothetical protein J2S21_001312 [Peribacillus cavernae]|nr:hypothetical protein [Peribacillus cavernae]